MVLNITTTLSLFLLIALSTAIFFAARRLKVPYTVLLTLVGLLLVPIVNLPWLQDSIGFLGDMVLTPELLFFIFLPILIFESGFNMNIRRMLDNVWSISLLSVVGLLISTLVIATLLTLVLPLVGIDIPFILALLFGAVISATDPAAALTLFKEAKAPRRLGMIFEGESLFNDGTAVALFLVVLAIATDGFHGSSTIFHGILDFSVMVLAGIAFGLVMAALFSRALRFTRKNEFVTVTLITISAHIVFILTELINESGVMHVSSIIATAVSSLFLGNYSRHIMTPKTNEYLQKLIEHVAFVVNSLVFLLAGLLFANSGVDFGQLWLPILVTVLVVMIARVISVYGITIPLNAAKLEARIPAAWQGLLAWGSLRGALAIIFVLMIPDNFTLEGWNYAYSPRDFLLALTIGCILATLFIKAPLIGPMIRRFKLDKPAPLDEAHEADLGVYYVMTERARLLAHKTKGFISPEEYKTLMTNVDLQVADLHNERRDLIKTHGESLFEQSLHLAMIDLERTTLERLFINHEISERPYRKIFSKLNLQKEEIERARHNEIDPSRHTDRKDIFDHMVTRVVTLFDKKSKDVQLEEQLQYYRAQMIIARKAVQGIERMQTEYDSDIFLAEPYKKVVNRYETYRKQSAKKVDDLVAKHRGELEPYLAELAKSSLSASGARAITYLSDNGLVDEETEAAIERRFAA
ncbi:MAG: cation:proton antiporter [Candidatus Saccharimonadales bacterium]